MITFKVMKPCLIENRIVYIQMTLKLRADFFFFTVDYSSFHILSLMHETLS